MQVITSAGYRFETDDTSIEVGQKVEIPIPKIETPTTSSDKVIRFLAQMYGLQKEWHPITLERYGAPDGLEHFPEFILTLREDRLRPFLVRMYSAGATLVRHYSSSSYDTPEVRFRCVNESLARELQYLWLRMGIKTRVVYHTQIKKWLVQTSGNASYVQMRDFIKSTKNPRLIKKMRELDSLVPFKFRMDQDFTIVDKVVEVIE